MNWKLFFKGLGAAAAGGAVTSTATFAGQWAQGAATGQKPHVSGAIFGSVALAGALTGVVGYMMHSPRTPR
jgi:hypothetical protein